MIEAQRALFNFFCVGFGSFVDKVTLPFVSTEPNRLKRPCADCAPAYSFKNHMSLSEDEKKFSNEVKQARVSGNLDSPEGGFDALMQVMTCLQEIGWRTQARRLIVFFTGDKNNKTTSKQDKLSILLQMRHFILLVMENWEGLLNQTMGNVTWKTTCTLMA